LSPFSFFYIVIIKLGSAYSIFLLNVPVFPLPLTRAEAPFNLFFFSWRCSSFASFFERLSSFTSFEKGPPFFPPPPLVRPRVATVWIQVFLQHSAPPLPFLWPPSKKAAVRKVLPSFRREEGFVAELAPLEDFFLRNRRRSGPFAPFLPVGAGPCLPFARTQYEL